MRTGRLLATSTPCPVDGKHSCSPPKAMSMLGPDFAAVRYFFYYRFPPSVMLRSNSRTRTMRNGTAKGRQRDGEAMRGGLLRLPR